MKKQNKADVATFARCEYLGDVKGLQNLFITRKFEINPNTPTFPWLSQIADSWEMFQFKYLRFKYRGIVSAGTDSSNQAEMGTAMATFVYDATEPIPTSKPEVLNYSGTKSCLTYEDMYFDVDVPKTPLYIQTAGTLPLNEDIREYQFGYFILSTQGGRSQATTQNCGEVYVEYEVSFWKSKITDYLGGGLLCTKVGGPASLGCTRYGPNPSQRTVTMDLLGYNKYLSTYIEGTPTASTGIYTINGIQGQIFEIEEIWSDGGSTLLPTTAGTDITNVSSTQTGIAVLQVKYSTTTVPAYTSFLTAYNSAQIIRKTCWVCTRSGDLSWSTNNTILAPSISSGVYYQFNITLLNKKCEFDQIEPVLKPSGWVPR